MDALLAISGLKLLKEMSQWEGAILANGMETFAPGAGT